MIRFGCDYQEGAHPRILQKLVEINFEQNPGYSEDGYCDKAREIIRCRCQAERAAVHFLVGGTQTNMIFLACALRAHHGVLAAQTGHIAVHESGAIEATGHKVLTLPAHDGKLTAEDVERACRSHFEDATHEHMVMPKAVYISQPTEVGTLYSRDEFEALRAVCDRYDLILYMDGARLGEALAALPELDLAYYASVCDAFYIGGTKQGLLMGEALVIVNEALQADFRYVLKQRGAMLAKGWLLGVQFYEMLHDDLYEALSRHAVTEAGRIRDAFAARGVDFLIDSPTNQQFPILRDEAVAVLREKYAFPDWERVDEHHLCVRFCTSWATRTEDVDALIKDIQSVDLCEEMLDVVDEDGVPAGARVTRRRAHREGIRHRTSHVWIARERGGKMQLLLQKRAAEKDSFPGCYDISSAGHIPAGDDFIPSALRELREELGLTASAEELIPCGLRRFGFEGRFHGVPFVDRQVTKVFVLRRDIEPDALMLQREEIESVLWIDLDTCMDMVRTNALPNCIYPEELDMVAAALNGR